MTRARDNQRSRVYAAENSVFTFGQTIPDALLQATLNDWLDRRPIRSRFGPRRITIERGKGAARAYGAHRITVGVRCRNEWLLCHELAHCLTPGAYAAHGPEYCGIYLFLVDLFIGPAKAAELRAAFRTRRVKWNNKAIPAPSTGTRVPPRQYERLADVKARLNLPTPEQAAARSAAGRRAWETRKATPVEPIAFPLAVRLGPKLADEMHYQREITLENAENDGCPEPQWRIEGRVLIVDDADALSDAEYRLDIVTDNYDAPGLVRSARSVLDGLKARKRATPVMN